MAIRLNKKISIILVILFCLILGGSGGYLLWRVNQPDTVAPTDSDATGGAGQCCGSAGCVAGWKCDKTKPCTEKKTHSCDPTKREYTCPVYKGVSTKASCSERKETAECIYNFGGTCVRDTNPQGPTEGTCPNKNSCEWPSVLMSDTCSCLLCQGKSVNGCGGNPPTSCTVPSCPSGYDDCGTSVSNNRSKDPSCVKVPDRKCTVYHPDCNNPSVIYRYCTSTSKSSNTCENGEWLTKPTGSYKYCDPISYTAKGKDKDGIDKTSVEVKLNNSKRTSISFTNETTTSLEFSESLSTTKDCLPVGTYTLDLSWKDKKGVTSSNCSLTTTFSILAEEQNPNWNISKKVTEQCLESGDAQLKYTIKIKNTGTGTGNIDKIVDTLDSKVLSSYITNTISNGGLFSNGTIIWDLEGADETFVSKQEKKYTYTIVIPKKSFGSYKNTVTAYPVTGDNFSDSVTVVVDCLEDIPQTGIFDSTFVKIIIGIVFLLLGFNLHRISIGIEKIQYSTQKLTNSIQKLTISIQESRNERRKRNFEKKIVKK